MRYCEGGCRRRWIKSEGKASSCRFHRAYVIDQENGDTKPYEICFKPTLWERLLSFIRNTFFKGFVEYDDLGLNRRKSKTVGKNIDALRGS